MTLKAEMIKAIVKELILRKDYLHDTTVKSVYFGGGTPSLLDELALNQLLDAVRNNFNLATDAEITLEANPDDITPEKLSTFHNAGVNRLSVGIQSFQPEILQWMNRAHNANEAIQCLEWIKSSSINNYSADLIYGIPIGTDAALLNDIECLLAFQPNHISTYCLTIEPKTVFGNKLKHGKLQEVDEEVAANQFLLIDEKLSSK